MKKMKTWVKVLIIIGIVIVGSRILVGCSHGLYGAYGPYGLIGGLF